MANSNTTLASLWMDDGNFPSDYLPLFTIHPRGSLPHARQNDHVKFMIRWFPAVI